MEGIGDLLVPLVGLAGVVIGALLTRQSQRDEREAARADALRVLVGAVNVLLVDALPDRIAFNLRKDESPETIRGLSEKWQSVKSDLAGHAALDKSPWVRDYTTRLLVEVDNLLTFDGWIVHDYLNDRVWDGAKKVADEHHDNALKLLFSLAREVRGEGRPTRTPLLSIWWSDPHISEEE
ncbi:MAG TPA: hypothetical protein VMS99_15310 [Acidimicrobiia bacterium]|nr:hypothetical protein [Acidimicrobiia bacterium]